MLRRGPRSLPLLSFYDIVVLLGFLNLYGMQLVGFLNDPGLGWHLANGAQILKTGILPNTDSFLASEVVRPWIADQWFADMAMAWLYAEGGWPLLSVSFFLLYFFTFFLVHYRCLRRVTQAPLVCGLVTLCVFKMSQVQFVARPLLFGFLFFTILYSLLYRMAKGEQRWPRTLFVLPLFFIWSCIHPSFVLGIFLMGIALVGFWLDRWRGITEHQPQLGRFVMLILGCIGATFLNPYGLDLYHTILWLGGSDIRNIYSEWQPLQLRSPEGIFFSIMVATIISRLIFLRHQVRSWEILSFFGFAYAALSAVRMLPYFAIASSVLFVVSITEFEFLLNRLPFSFATMLRQAWGKLDMRDREGGAGTVMMTALLLVCILFYSSFENFQTAQPSRQSFPYKSVEYLVALDGPKPVVVVNMMDFGGFIEFAGQGKVKPVADDRSSLLGDEFYRTHFKSLKIDGDWAGWAKRYDAQFMLLRPTQALSMHLKRCYPKAVVVEEPSALLFSVPELHEQSCCEV